ncbi:glycine-rich cell wall structural protein-like [Triticum dicoccoides]|uniref:glycine-rich cell wall structural protein-like n=1 Tax=Triticum dicoccoides TaxID=85692 RepID=UPI000E796F07|nr:glycine-rich cell wall structural protein-like [Triticum dicoccoides]
MASKCLIVVAVLLAGAFLVATAEQTQANKEDTEPGVQGGYPGHDGGGGGGYPGHGGGGGGGYPGHGGGGGGGCSHRCCGHGGCHCCAGPDEIPESKYRADVRN